MPIVGADLKVAVLMKHIWWVEVEVLIMARRLHSGLID